MDLLVLGAGDVAALLDWDELVTVLGEAFAALSSGRTSVPPRVAAHAPAGLLAAMPGYVEGTALVTKLVSVFAGNHRHGLPSHQALIVVFDDATGTPVALMDGTVITARRTAAASALSARLLARPGARVVAILGAGVQGANHVEAMDRVVAGAEFRIASRHPEHADALAAGRDRVTAVEGYEEAVRGADIVCLCTHASEPVIRREWLGGGVHVTSVGASPAGPEVDPETVAAARVFVESRVAVQPFPAGSHELQGVDPQTVTELGEVIEGRSPGRRDDHELTLYKSMGHAVEDAAAAALVLRRAREQGRGSRLTM